MDNGLSLFSLEAEQSVLGALLVDGKVWDSVSDRVSEECFVDQRNSLIFHAIRRLSERNSAVDGISVSECLKAAGRLEDAGGLQYLGELIKNCPSSYNATTYADIVRQRSQLRRLRSAVASCGAILEDPDTTLGEKAELAAKTILDAADNESSDIQLFSLKDGFSRLYERLERVHKAGGALTGLSTGFADIDKRTNGLHPGELFIVAARPGMGKTNFALNVAHHISQTHKVLFVSLEMSRDELSGRFAACGFGMDYGSLQAMHWEGFSGPLGNAIGAAADFQIKIDDRAGQTLDRLRRSIKRARRELGGLDLVIVDYLQLLRAKGNSRYEQVTEISQTLKVMAKDFDLPVMCLAQLNRANEQRSDKRPQLSDLRDSGAIEQDADVVMFLHREEMDDGSRADEAEAIFRKIRHGKEGTDPLLCDFRHCRFLTADRSAWEAKMRELPVKAKRGSGYDRA